MTAITRAQKLKAKRGRPRIDNVPREPNGRASRSEDPPNLVALAARVRRHGITLDQAHDQKAGSFLGLLYMRGRVDGLSEAQYEAAMKYQEIRRDYLKANQIPDATRDNGVRGSSGDTISDEYIRWCQKANARYGAARRAIQEAQNATRAENLWSAVHLVIIEDQHHDAMIGATRVVCNALARHFQQERRT